MIYRFILTLGVVLIVLSPTAKGDTARISNCFDHEVMINYLKGKYNESPTALGLSMSGTILEILTSPNGTWTVIKTYPNNYSCIIEVGQSWVTLSKIKGQEL